MPERGQPMQWSPKSLPADMSSRAAERALGSGQGLAAPPTLPISASQPTGRLWPQPRHSAAPLSSFSQDTASSPLPGPSKVPTPLALLSSWCQCVCSVSYSHAHPRPQFGVSSLPVQTIPSANVIQHHIKLLLDTQHVLFIRALLTVGADDSPVLEGCSGHCRMLVASLAADH